MQLLTFWIARWSLVYIVYLYGVVLLFETAHETWITAVIVRGCLHALLKRSSSFRFGEAFINVLTHSLSPGICWADIFIVELSWGRRPPKPRRSGGNPPGRESLEQLEQSFPVRVGTKKIWKRLFRAYQDSNQWPSNNFEHHRVRLSFAVPELSLASEQRGCQDFARFVWIFLSTKLTATRHSFHSAQDPTSLRHTYPKWHQQEQSQPKR